MQQFQLSQSSLSISFSCLGERLSVILHLSKQSPYKQRINTATTEFKQKSLQGVYGVSKM